VVAEARRPFDLETSALPRFTLFRCGPENHVLLIVVHHIVSDLWSFIVLMDELRDLYQAEVAGVASRLPELPVSYEDYVRSQRRLLQGSHGDRLWNYWRGELSGELPVLDLPTDYPRPPAQSFRGGTVYQRLDAGLTTSLKELARRECVTLYTVLLAAYQVF